MAAPALVLRGFHAYRFLVSHIHTFIHVLTPSKIATINILRFHLNIHVSSYRSYKHASKQCIRHPVLTGIATTTSISIVGDISCQYLEYRSSYQYQSQHNNILKNRKFQWNYIRTMKFATVGFCLAPQLVVWYRFIQHQLPGKPSFMIASKRMLVDQFIFASWSTAYCLGFATVLNGGDIKDVHKQIDAKWYDSYKVNLLLWPPAQIINFWFIPPHFRVLWTNFIAFGWTTFMSFKAYQTIKE